MTMLKDIPNYQRLDKESDIFKFWAVHQNKELAELCLTVLALPTTQVSVERTFSGLKYIMNDLRMNLKADIIDVYLY